MGFILLAKFDRIYYLCLLSFLLSLTSYIYLLFWASIIPVGLFGDNSAQGDTYVSLIESGSLLLMLIAFIPVIFTLFLLISVNRRGLQDRGSKINLWITTLFYYSYIIVTIMSFGFLYMPAVVFLTAATVSTLVYRSRLNK